MSAPKATRIPAGDKGTADRVEADDGMYWVRLVTRQALDREGAAMGHCVGDGGYDSLVGGEEIYDDSIWSLRRADGVSILTVRIQEHEIDYARGPLNHEPGRGAALQIRHLVAGYTERSFQQLLVDEDTGVVLVEDGRTFRLDRLPPDVAAARQASQVAPRSRQESRRRRALERDFDRIIIQEPVEIRTDENSRRPIIQHGTAPPPPPAQSAFLLTANEADPVVEMSGICGRPGQRFRTCSGVQFAVEDFDLRMAGGNWNEAVMAAYRAAIREAARPGTAHSTPVAGTTPEARRAALLAIISPEAERRRQLQDEAYDRDIARILGRAA